VAVAGSSLHPEQRAQRLGELITSRADSPQQGYCLVVIVALGVLADRNAADRICGGDTSMNVEGHACVSDVLLIVRELAERFRCIDELLSLPQTA
jgi:hypothetical protein